MQLDFTALLPCVARAAVLRQLRHPNIVEFKGVGALHMENATAMRRSMFLVQVPLTHEHQL